MLVVWMPAGLLRSSHCTGLYSYAFFVLQTVLTKSTKKTLMILGQQLFPHQHSPVNCVSFCLSWILDIRLIQQVLNAQENLFDCDCRTPVFFLIQKRQADSARRIDVRMEQRRLELALGRARRVVVLEDHAQVVQASFPWSSFLAGNGALPSHQIKRSVCVLHWTCHKALTT